MSYREFRQAGRVNTRTWHIKVEGPTVFTKHGMLGGILTPTQDTKKAVNVGKANEKTPEVVAQEHAERQILLKRRQGYIEHVDGVPVGRFDKTINWEALPISLRFWKPTNQMRKGLITQLRDGEAWALRKRDGMAYPILHDELGVVQMYSRVMLPTHKNEPDIPWNERFPHIADEVATVCRMHSVPTRTLFLGEVVADKPDTDLDDFALVESVTKSLTPAALEAQAELGRLRYYVWDIAFWGGNPACAELPLQWRYGLIHDLFHNCDYIDPVDIFDNDEIQAMRRRHDTGPVEALRAEAERLGWEGWVVVDPKGVMGDRAWNLRGKTDRPPFAGKLKPIYEDDFVAYWDPSEGLGEYGTGRHQGCVKSLALFQYDSKGELVRIAQAGSGLTDQMKRQLADPSKFPIVVQVEFDGWTPKGSLRFPRIKRIRDDKEPHECVNPKL